MSNNNDNHSCLVKSYLAQAELRSNEISLLASLEDNPQEFERGHTIVGQGNPQRKLYVVSKGWCFNYVHDHNGRRQILDIHMPGDIAGTREVAYNTSVSALETATDCVLCPFPRTKLNDLFGNSSRLTGIFFLISMRRESILMERIVNLGRRDAFQRICHYMAETKDRLELLNGHEITRMRQPFTQAQLSDTMGLSEVHISRVFKRLKDSGMVSIDSQYVEFLDTEALIDAAQFSDHHLNVDKRWLNSA